MNSATLATNLLGRRVRLHRRPEQCATDCGQIATVYIDNRGMHYVLLIEGRLVPVDDGSEFTVLEDPVV